MINTKTINTVARITAISKEMVAIMTNREASQTKRTY